MAMLSTKAELSKGYKIVPWSSWDQWNFVRTNIFSSSPYDVEKALAKISGWRSRGCLPVPVDVTAAFVEIQLSDPFFRKEREDGGLKSEEMLAMLYSMSIIRLVNCFLEPTHKKTRLSISQLADAVGIPRMLIDIRHESSHRELPSIQLVRSASVKALDWLKDNYWEPQRKAISDVRVEIRSRLSELTCYLRAKKTKNTSSDAKRKSIRQTAILSISNKLSSQICVKLNSSKLIGSDRQISKMAKTISRLYSSYPLEVVSVFLEIFHLQAHDLSSSSCMENSDDSDGEPLSAAGSSSELKTIISRLSTKRPHLILSILKSVLETIEACELNKVGDGRNDTVSINNQADKFRKRNLSSLVYWLLMNLKRLKDADRLELLDKAKIPLQENTAIPRVSLAKLLQKCLMLAVVGDKYLLDSVVLLAEMMSNGSLKEKLQKFPLFCQQDWCNNGNEAFPDTESMLSVEEALVNKEAKELEKLRLQLNNRKRKGTGLEDNNRNTGNLWAVTKSWIPCPIGMVPCSLSATAILPVLDNLKGDSKTNTEVDKVETECQDVYEGPFDFPDLSEDETCYKRLKLSIDEENVDYHKKPSPMEDLLLINGIWKKVSEEEFLEIQSDIRTFAS